MRRCRQRSVASEDILESTAAAKSGCLDDGRLIGLDRGMPKQDVVAILEEILGEADAFSASA